MNHPQMIRIEPEQVTAERVREVGYMTANEEKIPLLIGLMRHQNPARTIVFVNTKRAADRVWGYLEGNGFHAAILSGDVPQKKRLSLLKRFQTGELPVLVATDVAARGLDVERISHVVNFDVPYDSESYVHRIGRTGRAGRSGEAILFIAPRERNMLRIIERATRQPIEPMSLPTVHDVNQRRVAKFKERLAAALEAPSHEAFRPVIEEFVSETGADITDAAMRWRAMSGKCVRSMPT
jgi:superfamily II DNA/RNA helicase